MSRKDYQLIADVISDALDHAETDAQITLKRFAKKLAAALKTDNAAFKPDVFFRACHLDDLAAN